MYERSFLYFLSNFHNAFFCIDIFTTLYVDWNVSYIYLYYWPESTLQHRDSSNSTHNNPYTNKKAFYVDP